MSLAHPNPEYIIPTFCIKFVTICADTGVGVALARGQLPSFERRRQLTNGCDILVVTPGTLNQYMEEKWISVANVHFIVIDEADKFIAVSPFHIFFIPTSINFSLSPITGG